MEDLIDYIRNNLTKKRLEDVSSLIINAYKKDDELNLKAIAESLNIDSTTGIKQIFYRLIQRLHPDRFTLLIEDFNRARVESDYESLRGLKDLLDIKVNSNKKVAERFEYSHREEWMSERMFEQDYDQYLDDEESFEEENLGDFLRAIKSEMFGNNDFYIELTDLIQLDGSLNLSFYSLKDIEGIEYCKNIESLDITGNRISNIYELSELWQIEELYAAENDITDIAVLSKLKHLEILDISNNDIEDFSPLLNMENLKFVDISKNPIEDFSVIKKLKDKGIILINYS